MVLKGKGARFKLVGDLVFDEQDFAIIHRRTANYLFRIAELPFERLKKEFGTEQTVTVAAGGTQVISKGVYYVACGANTSVEYSPDGGTTWRTLIAAGGSGLVISDGSNVRLNNAGAAAEDSYLLPIQ